MPGNVAMSAQNEAIRVMCCDGNLQDILDISELQSCNQFVALE